MVRLWSVTDAAGDSIELLALTDSTPTVVLAGESDGEHAAVAVTRRQAIDLRDALTRWLDR